MNHLNTVMTLGPVGRLAGRVRRAVIGADRDIALLSDYLVGALSATEQAEVEDRLASDAGFARKANVLMGAWDQAPALALLPANGLRQAEEVTEDGEDLAERTARVFYEVRDALGFPKRAYVAYRSDSDRERRRLANRWKRQSQWATAAATLFFAAWFGRMGFELHQAHAVASRQGAEIVEHRASTAFLPDNETTMFETGTVETRDIVVKGTAHVVLGPNSRVVEHEDAVTLDGAAVIVVPASAGYVVVHTYAMRGVFMPGRYAIDAPPGQATVVTADSGEAHVAPLGDFGASANGVKTNVVVRGGQKVQVSPMKAELVR